MKTSEEMVKSLFERREQYVKEQKKKKLSIAVTSLVMCFAVMAAAIGLPTVIGDGKTTPSVNGEKNTSSVEKENKISDIESENLSDTEKEKGGLINNNEKTTKEKVSEFINNEKSFTADYSEGTSSEKKGDVKVASGKIEISLFEATEKASDTDSFGEDELRHIDVTLNGYKFYTQLKKSDYNKYGIKKYLKKSDFGKKLGVITEIDGQEKALKTPCSQEPALDGCEVYLYKPVNSEAVIIVKGNGHCSLFYFSSFLESGYRYNDNYKIFNVTSSEDIERIDFSVMKPDGTIIIPVEKGSITDKNDINDFMNITKGLIPYTRESALSGDPEWLNNAHEEYNKNDENRVWIGASVVLKNGLVIPFEYEPNLGTGFVPGHFFLSEKDNAVLMKMFKM